MARKIPIPPMKAWRGIPSPDKTGWQYLILHNPRTGEWAKVEVPKRYAYDARDYEIPESVKNAKVKGVRYATHKKTNEWDARTSKKELNTYLSNGFSIIPPDRIAAELGIKSPADAKKFNPQREKRPQQGQPGQPGQQGQAQPGQQGQPMPGQPGQPGQAMSGQPGQPGQPMPGQPGQPGQPSPDQSGQSQDYNQNQTPAPSPEQIKQNKAEAKAKAQAQAQEGTKAVNPDALDQNGQADDSKGKESEEDKKQREKAEKEVSAAAEKAEKSTKKNSAGSFDGESLEDKEDKKQEPVQYTQRRPRKRRGGRLRVGKKVTKVDRYARGEASLGKKRGVYSYGDITFNSKTSRAAKRSAELLAELVGKSTDSIESGLKVHIQKLVVALYSDDNPLPALEVPGERKRIKVMISPDCSPSTQEWNGLACAWAIALAKKPDVDVLYIPNSNGDPVKISSDLFLTNMKSSDIIIYLGDSDGMQDNLNWAKMGMSVIALSSANYSIADIPKHKKAKNSMHLVVQKFDKGIIRYVNGVSSTKPSTWVRALEMCMDSLKD